MVRALRAQTRCNLLAAPPSRDGRERGNPTFRFLDRYAGIPVVVAAGLLRRRRGLPKSLRRIGIVNGGAIGDTVLLSPVAADIAAAYPEAETLFFASPAMVPMLRQLDGLTPLPIEITKPRRAVATLRDSDLDVLMDFTPWPRIVPLYALVSRASFTAGFEAAGQFRHHAYDAAVGHSPLMHELDNYRRLASLIGVKSRSEPVFRPFGALPKEALPPAPYAVLHLWPTGVQSGLKEWTPARWRSVVSELGTRKLTVVLTGGKADAARSAAFAKTCASTGARVIDAAGRYGLDQLVDVVHASRCVISVNTGVAHLAAAVGVPTITLNGPTSARRWGPLGARSVSVDSSLPGCGYLNMGWEYYGQRRDCMDGVEVERVLSCLRRALDA